MADYKTIEKERVLFFTTRDIHDKIVTYFNNLEDGIPNELEFATIAGYISQFEKNMRKLMASSYAMNPKVAEWNDDLDFMKIMKFKKESEDGLVAAKKWMLNTYNSYSKDKGWATTISEATIDKFIKAILRYDNIMSYKNIIKRLIIRQMSSPALFKTINGIIFNSNGRTDEGLQFNFNKKLSLNEGFFNPFDEDDNLNGEKEVKKIQIDSPKKMVKSVKLWESNRKNKIYFAQGKVFSSRLFAKGDVVEECPVKLISTASMYSPEIREIAFEVDPERRLYGIPEGLANSYRNSDDTGTAGNVDYEYDPKEGIIRIYALNKIRPNDELVFQVKNDLNFGNGLKKYQFKY